MTREVSKSVVRRGFDRRFVTRWFVGDGIDIGAGDDPLSQFCFIFPLMGSARVWDKADGDAMLMQGVDAELYDFVHSSHCLEHTDDPAVALSNWIRICRKGGHLVITVPDEDLYEQGVFPSTFNSDHKWTFTIAKAQSWCPKSINMIELLGRFVHEIEVIKIELLDLGYIYGRDREDQTLGPLAELAIEIILRKKINVQTLAQATVPPRLRASVSMRPLTYDGTSTGSRGSTRGRSLSDAGLTAPRDSVSQHTLRPARDLKSRLDAYPRVLVAILAKQKEEPLPLFLRCIEELDYPKSSIVLYVRTNNNTDRTEQILRDWIARVGSCYAAVEFDATPVEEPVETFGQHEWNATRFRVLGNIRNVSLSKTGEHACDFYFVCDVDNFIRPCTLRELVALKLPIVAPLLRITDPNGYYSNFFAEIDPNGFYGHCDQYQWILQRRVRGVFEVPLVHCTYLIRGDVIPKLRYLDGSDRYEFVVLSDGARKAGIQQYIDNRQVYGYITFDAESDAATGIVGDQRDDQIAFVRREMERQHGQKLSIQESSMDTMPTISVMAPRRPSNDFANGFNELSETIFYGLRHLGYHARIVSRLSEADGQIIVVGANTLSDEEAMQLPAGTVIYNAEPFPQVCQVFPRYTNEVLRKYKVWDYNPENAKRLSASLGKAVEYVPLGYVPELTRIEKTDLEDIDVLFYGTVNARRRTILDRLEATGLKVNILCGVFGTERNAWIARSKVVLNVHSHEPGVFEMVRVAFLLANAKAVVSECNPGYAGEAVDADLLPGIVAAKYDDLVEACVSLVADDDRRHAIEQVGFAAFRERREGDILREALAALS